MPLIEENELFPGLRQTEGRWAKMAASLDVDRALTLLGDWSRWRLVIYLTLGAFKGILAAWQMFGIVFIGRFRLIII